VSEALFARPTRSYRDADLTDRRPIPSSFRKCQSPSDHHVWGRIIQGADGRPPGCGCGWPHIPTPISVDRLMVSKMNIVLSRGLRASTKQFALAHPGRTRWIPSTSPPVPRARPANRPADGNPRGPSPVEWIRPGNGGCHLAGFTPPQRRPRRVSGWRRFSWDAGATQPGSPARPMANCSASIPP